MVNFCYFHCFLYLFFRLYGFFHYCDFTISASVNPPFLLHRSAISAAPATFVLFRFFGFYGSYGFHCTCNFCCFCDFFRFGDFTSSAAFVILAASVVSAALATSAISALSVAPYSRNRYVLKTPILHLHRLSLDLSITQIADNFKSFFCQEFVNSCPLPSNLL